MKLNWAERWVVNNPVRAAEQSILIRSLQKMQPLQPGATVLEIGCGRGAGAVRILDTFRPAVLHAMDLDIDMIRKAGKYVSAGRREKAFFYTGDALHLPYRDGALDAVFGFGVLHHIPDWRGAVAEIARVLRVGGSYYVEELYPSLYQNFLTKHILLHPEQDRFFGPDLKAAFYQAKLFLKDAMELRRFGLLGVCIKTA